MRNWAGNVDYSTDDVRAPETLEELQELVAGTSPVRATGTRHSFSTVVDTTGALVSTARLGLALEIDETSGIAWVPAAATYADVVPSLDAAGWALHNMGSLPHISVGGACSTGTHGSGVGNGCLASRVVGVELVSGTGDLVTGRAGDRDFPGLVLALGSLGVVTRLAVQLERSYQVCQEVVLDVPVRSVVDNVAEVLGSAYSVSLFISFRNRAVVDSVWLKHRGASPADLGDVWGGRRAPAKVHPIVGIDAEAATDQLGSSGPWHERLPHFKPSFTPSAGEEIQSEFFVPIDRAAEVLSTVAERADEFSSAVQVMEIRTVAADDMWLSPFRGRETLAVHATWISDLRVVRPALERLERVLAPFEPRPHWGKYFLGFDRDQVESTYPMLPEFRDLAQRLDPERRFVNEFVTRLGIR